MNAATTPVIAWLLSRWRWFAGAGILLLLYAIAGFFLVPRLARSAIEDFTTQQIGKQVAIEKIEFNPFLLAANVTGFRLTEPDGRPLVAFEGLYVNVQLSTLWHRALTFAEIRLTRPAIDAVIAPDGAINLAGLVPPATEPVESSTPEPLPAIRIGLLQVSSGRIGIEDQTRPTPFRAEVTPIQFSLNDFRTAVDYQNAYRFAGTTEAGEQLEWAGEFSVQPLGSTGTFSVTNLRAGTLWSYVRDDVAFTFPSGSLSLGGTYRLSVSADNQVDLGIDLPEIRMSDYTIAPKEPEGTTPWISIPELVLRQTSFSLRERRVSVQEIALDGARVEVWREADGTLNLNRLAGTAVRADPVAGATPAVPAPSAPASGSAPAASTAPDWQAEVGSVAIRELTVNASDRSIEPVVDIALTPISLTLTGLTADPARTFDLAAEAGINQTGLLKVQGKLRWESLLADLDVELTEFGLPVLQPYLSQATAMTVGSGRLGLKGHVNYAADATRPQPQLKFTGRVDVADFASRDTVLNEDFLKWKLLSITGIDYSYQPDRLTIDRVSARDPYARVIISKDAKLNVTQVLNPRAEEEGDGGQRTGDSGKDSPSQPQPPNAASAPVMPMRINAVVIENGSANFADFSVEPSFATGIQSLAGTIRGLSSNPDTRAKVDLKGSVDRFSPVVIAGEVNLLSAALYTDIGVSFSNMELTTFNPYSGKFAGYSIAKGKLSTELKYKVQDRALEAEHHVVIDQLEFGAATDSKDAVPLPIKLAVALLKDRNGVIDINLPVRGSIDDPTFRLGPIIWKAVVGLLTKIVTAPFALLGSLFGGGEDLAFVEFEPGVALLTPAATEKLASLAKALAERPQLKLDIPLAVHTAVDAEEMARASLAQKVPTPVGDPNDIAMLQQHLQALTRASAPGTGLPPPAAVPAGNATPAAPPTPEALRMQIDALQKSLLASLAPTADQLDALARSRAEAVQGALLGSGEIAAERVFLTARPAAQQSTTTVVRMELKLE